MTFIEFGDQPRPAGEVLRDILKGRRSSSTASAYAGRSAAGCHSEGSSSDSLEGRLLRHAMGLLCRVVELDHAGHFLMSDSHCPTHNLTHLYCSLQALELEWEDVRAQLATSPSNEKLMSSMHHIQQQVVQSVDALERTLIDLALRSPPKMPLLPSETYIAQFLQSLSDALRVEAWPSQLLATFPSGFEEERHRLLTGLLPSSSAAAAMSQAAGEELLCRLGEGTTSILMKAMNTVREMDSNDRLQISRAPPTTVLAAALSSGSESLASSPTGGTQREAIHMGELSFAGLMAKAWSGSYALQGVRRADLEVTALFYHLRQALSAPSQSSQDDTLKSSAARDIDALAQVWTAALNKETRAFFVEAAPGELPSAFMRATTVFDVLHGVPNESLRPVQQATLRVVASLRLVDEKGWFAVPAFDRANTDFTTIELWVRNPSFALKSNRGAFEAVRRVLERMVDGCVAKYGPTHEFSECITSVRHKLVDVARREGLL